MVFENVTLLIAFAAGILSFISPCVLPLIPSYVSYISGISFNELSQEQVSPQLKKKILINSLCFTLGFSVVFIAIGTAVTALGQFFSSNQDIIRKAGSVFIILMGIHVTGILPIKALLHEMGFAHKIGKPAGYTGSFLVGIGFAAGWTPCIGPILTSILIVAGTGDSLLRGIFLLISYSAGFAIPFLLTSLAIHKFLRFSGKYKKYIHLFSKMTGFFLIGLGVMIYTNSFVIFTSYMNTWFPFLILN